MENLLRKKAHYKFQAQLLTYSSKVFRVAVKKEQRVFFWGGGFEGAEILRRRLTSLFVLLTKTK